MLWPTLWGLWLAGEGTPDQGLFVVFVMGVIVMRSAGCVLNDYVDRNIDPYVERTRTRPIASGAVAPMEALILFAALSLIAIGLATMLNRPAQLLAIVAAGTDDCVPFRQALCFHSTIYSRRSFRLGRTDGVRRTNR